MTNLHPVAAVTGAASGIGLATAHVLADAGYDIVMVDRDEPALASAAEEVGARSGRRIVPVGADMAVADQVSEVFAVTEAVFGRLDAVVNNAGVQRSGAVDVFDEDTWDLLMGVNPKSCFLSAKYALPLLERSEQAAIVNISSIAGLRGGPGQSAYSASKGAIVAFSRSLAVELAPRGIRVNCLCPGWVDTPFNAPAIEFMGGRSKQDEMIAATVPMGRQGTPEEIARTVRFLVSEDSSYLLGQALVVDGGQI